MVSSEIKTVKRLESSKTRTNAGQFKRLESKVVGQKTAHRRPRAEPQDKMTRGLGGASRRPKKVLSIHDANMMLDTLQHTQRKRSTRIRADDKSVESTMQKAMTSAHSTGVRGAIREMAGDERDGRKAFMRQEIKKQVGHSQRSGFDFHFRGKQPSARSERAKFRVGE